MLLFFFFSFHFRRCRVVGQASRMYFGLTCLSQRLFVPCYHFPSFYRIVIEGFVVNLCKRRCVMDGICPRAS